MQGSYSPHTTTIRLALAIARAARSICLEESEICFSVDGVAGGVPVPDNGTYKVMEEAQASARAIPPAIG
jgi:hypothetical protein